MAEVEEKESKSRRFCIPGFLEPPPPQSPLQPAEAHCEEMPPHQEKKTNLWQPWAGLSVMTFGVVLPLLAVTVAGSLSLESIWHMVLRRPLETAVECGLAVCIPFANYSTWSAILAKESRHPIRLGLINGAAITGAMVAFVLATIPLFLNYPMLDADGVLHPLPFLLVSMVSLMAAASAIYQAEQLRISKSTRGARLRTVLYSTLGVLLSLTTLAGTEAYNTSMRFAEHLAMSDSPQERISGLSYLRQHNPERDLRMDCADPRSSGLPGLFLRFDDYTLRQLYFSATGKPYKHTETADVTLQSDSFLSRHVVGEPVSGLSLVRSQLSGSLNSGSLSSTLEWTFVFKNKTFTGQEARAEIALPPHAVISGLTLWMDGEPRKAAFGATDKVKEAYNWIVVNHRDPALVTDLGRGRVLLQCYPVPAQGELKARVKVTAPLALDSPAEASLNLPRLIDSNFAVSHAHSVQLKSHQDLEMGVKKVRQVKTPNGDQLITADVADGDLSGSGLAVRVKRSAAFGAVAAADPCSKVANYIVETIKEVPARIPQHLVVVLDGSQSVKEHITDIRSALAKLPSGITSSLIVAADESNGQIESTPLTDGLKNLSTYHFTGGNDNLEAVIKAAEEAGDSDRGAVLWIHGPQPGFNREIYIMTPFAAVPAFYDLDVENGGTNLNEFFKNHREIGPFIPVARSSSVGKDLQRLIARWQPDGKEYVVEYGRSNSKPSQTIAAGEQASELAGLWAADRCAKLLGAGNMLKAAEVAIQYGLVTPVSGATVLENKVDYQKFGLTEDGSKVSNQSKPAESNKLAEVAGQMAGTQGATNGTDAITTSYAVQGATNGTIGPQAGDATVVQGINTAGSVRVNNLASLEALLNFLSYGFEILGLALGVFHIIAGVMNKPLAYLLPGCPCRMSPKARILLGVMLALVAIMVPGCINWLVASACDANLFS